MDIFRRALELESYYTQVRRRIHRHPETALEEKETCLLVMEELEKLGIRARRIGDTTGVTALICGEKPGPVTAIRADMDALPLTEASGLPFASEIPGKCHACGHDLHTAMLLMTAALLQENRDRLAGSVKLIFQPGEEGQKGAKLLLAEGILEDPPVERILAAHTGPGVDAGKIGVRKGAMMAASDRFYLDITGRGGHGAHPDQCIDPIMAAVHIIEALQTIVSREIHPSDPGVISIGKIVGGTSPNVIPDQVHLEGTVRSLSSAVRQQIHRRIREKAEAAAGIEGVSLELRFDLGAPPVVNDDRLVEELIRSVEKTLGPEKLVLLPESSMEGEDYARYLEQVPGLFFRIGTGTEDPATRLPLHSTGIRFSEEAIPAGAAAIAGMLLQN